MMSEFYTFSLYLSENKTIFFNFETFSPAADLGAFLAQFTQVLIFHRSESYFRFYLHCSENMTIFFNFENFSKKSKKIEVFAHRRSGDIFGSTHKSAHFSSQCVNFYILVVLE